MSNSEILAEDECLRLLEHSKIGRLGVVVDGYPLIFPVNYALDEGVVTFRTEPGTKFEAAQHGKVSFEVDQMTQPGRSAWSVLMLGAASVPATRDPSRLQRLQELDITPLDPAEKPLWVQVIPHRITGRRVTAEEQCRHRARPLRLSLIASWRRLALWSCPRSWR